MHATLDFLFDPNRMMSPYGVRSLSANDLLFHKDEDYWRGNVWINVNYLVYRGLQKYYSDYPHLIRGISIKEHIHIFRNNLTQNVKQVFESTGWLWEQYSEETGDGKRGHPFSGWSSLILLILTDKF